MSEQMIDVSYAQGVLTVAEFQAYKAGGVTHVALRASRDDSALAQDSVYPVNVANARAAGLSIGHYHFNGNVATPAECAQFLLAHITLEPGDFVASDVEGEPGVTVAWTDDQNAEFHQVIQAAHPEIARKTYMSQSLTTEAVWQKSAALTELWVAAYMAVLGPIKWWSTYWAWQYTDNGFASVLGRGVDTSIFAGQPGASPVIVSTNGTNTTGVATSVLQQELNWYGYNLAIDNIYGPATTNAVKDYQTKHGLAVDGDAGPQTQASLIANHPSGAVSTPAKPAPVRTAVPHLDTDGKLGPLTIGDWQMIMRTPVDNTISTPSVLVKAVQNHLNAAGARDQNGQSLVVDGLGIEQNGVQTKTIWALQRYLGLAPDGTLSTPVSPTVAALQARLNQGWF